MGQFALQEATCAVWVNLQLPELPPELGLTAPQ